MGGHDHHHEPYTVPKYTEYKIEDAPELVKLQERLAAKGLKDPWIRNYVWRYHKKWGTQTSRWIAVLTRGMPLGIGLFLATIGIEKALGVDYHPWMHEHHGEHGEHEDGHH